MCSCAIRWFPATGSCSANCSRPECPNAAPLQNLAIHCGYASFGLNRADAEFCIATRGLSRAETLALVGDAAAAGNTVAVMSPYDGRERRAMCLQIVAAHRSTTVDNRGYLLVFNNNLPKQHFRI